MLSHSPSSVRSYLTTSGIDHDPGVLVDSANQVLKGIYIRGLAEARKRNPGTDIARYIEAYTYVQVRRTRLVTGLRS